jgi:DNA polymerase-3 subunit epsilon
MEYSLEQMARSLVESGDYRVTSRLEPQTEYYPPDDSPKLVAAVVDVETTGTNSESDKIIELGICLFEYARQTGRIYKILGSWEWFEDPCFSIPPEITTITGITDAMVAGHRIERSWRQRLATSGGARHRPQRGFRPPLPRKTGFRVLSETLGVQPFRY